MLYKSRYKPARRLDYQLFVKENIICLQIKIQKEAA